MSTDPMGNVAQATGTGTWSRGSRCDGDCSPWPDSGRLDGERATTRRGGHVIGLLELVSVGAFLAPSPLVALAWRHHAREEQGSAHGRQEQDADWFFDTRVRDRSALDRRVARSAPAAAPSAWPERPLPPGPPAPAPAVPAIEAPAGRTRTLDDPRSPVWGLGWPGASQFEQPLGWPTSLARRGEA